jgi:hypothetical protein
LLRRIVSSPGPGTKRLTDGINGQRGLPTRPKGSPRPDKPEILAAAAACRNLLLCRVVGQFESEPSKCSLIKTSTALCADTKLICCWQIGSRSASSAYALMHDLASRLSNRLQLTTDGICRRGRKRAPSPVAKPAGSVDIAGTKVLAPRTPENEPCGLVTVSGYKRILLTVKSG